MATDMVMGIGIIMFSLLYITFNVDEEHFMIKLLSFLFALGLMFLIPNAAAYGATSAVITSVIRVVSGYFTLISLYIITYLLWHYLSRFRKEVLR